MAESYVYVEINSNKMIKVLDKLPDGKSLANYSNFDDVVTNMNDIQDSKYIAIKIAKQKCVQDENCIRFDGNEYEMMLSNLLNNTSGLTPIDDAFLKVSSYDVVANTDFVATTNGSEVANTDVLKTDSDVVATTNGSEVLKTDSDVVATTNGSEVANTDVLKIDSVTKTDSNKGGRRGVPNVGNSCWANGVYQLLYDAEDFRENIINGDWKLDYLTRFQELTNSANGLNQLSQEEKTKKSELEAIFPKEYGGPGLSPDQEVELTILQTKEDTSDWSWVKSQSITPQEYSHIFGSSLQQIFKYIRGVNDKLTYETTFIPVLLFPDDYKRQQDSREFIQQLKIKTDTSNSNDSDNLLHIDEYFGVYDSTERYYVENKEQTDILISENGSLMTDIVLKMNPDDEKKTDLSVQKMIDFKTEEAEFNLKETDIEGLKFLNPNTDETKLKDIKSKGVIPINIIQGYTNFSNHLLVTLVREKYIKETNKKEKITTKVVFNNEITINNSKFELIGIVVHSGDANSGHYVYESIVNNQEYNDSVNQPLYTTYNQDYVENNWSILLFKNKTVAKEEVAKEEVAKEEVPEEIPEEVAKEEIPEKVAEEEIPEKVAEEIPEKVEEVPEEVPAPPADKVPSAGGRSLKNQRKKNKKTKRKYYVYGK